MNWQDHLVNMRQSIYVEGPAKGTYDTSRLIPPQRMELRMTAEQEERCTLVEITNGRFHVPCPVPIDRAEVFRELLAPGWYSGTVKLNEAVERYRRELQWTGGKTLAEDVASFINPA